MVAVHWEGPVVVLVLVRTVELLVMDMVELVLEDDDEVVERVLDVEEEVVEDETELVVVLVVTGYVTGVELEVEVEVDDVVELVLELGRTGVTQASLGKSFLAT